MFCNDSNETMLFKIVDLHFFQNSVIFGKNSQHLRSDAFQEILQFFNINEENELLQYSLVSWYSEDSWKLWGRRHVSKVSLCRTTVRVEAHRFVIKRLYLLAFNLPRLDFLAHILNPQIMLKFRGDYSCLLDGSKNPSWWKAFVTE